jgi:glucose/arabinose dehydrogenase
VKALVAGLVVLAGVLAGSPLQSQPRVTIVASGLQVPWALAFAPDGRLFLTERAGRIRVVHEGRLHPKPVATLPVAARGEGGLMGLALDPEFAKTGRLYVCYTLSKRGSLVNRLALLTLGQGRGAVERVLVDDIPGATVHDGCRVKFGPDGKLYVTTGDASEPRLAQRLDSLAGKILRYNADGTVPTDNPFPGSPVYSLGHRNPQGLAWDGAGQLFASEHGPSGIPGGHDELSFIRPGRNYGWPDVYGRAGREGFDDPVLESGFRTWAPAGMAILDGVAYIATLRGRQLLRVNLAADGSATTASPLLNGDYGRLRDVVVGPDGALYIATSNRDGRGSPAASDDRILRLVP